MGKFVFMCVYYQNLVSFSNYAFVFNILSLSLFLSFLSIEFRYVVLRLFNVGNLKRIKGNLKYLDVYKSSDRKSLNFANFQIQTHICCQNTLRRTYRFTYF